MIDQELSPLGEGGVRPVKSAERTVAVLELLSECRGPVSLKLISDRLDIPRASAHALLLTLVKHGWVDHSRGEYRLGLGSLRTSAAFVESDAVVQQAERIITALNRRLSETIHLARLDGSEVVYLVTSQSPHSLSSVSRPGRRMPAWLTALGKSILAERPWKEVERILPDVMPAMTPKSLSSREALREDLERTRERGYAIDDEESSIGLKCRAVAVGLEQPVMYALSCPVPSARLDSEREALITELLLQAKADLRTD